MTKFLEYVFTVKVAGFTMMLSAPAFYIASKNSGVVPDDSVLMTTMLMTLITSGANLIGLGTKTA